MFSSEQLKAGGGVRRALKGMRERMTGPFRSVGRPEACEVVIAAEWGGAIVCISSWWDLLYGGF